MQIGTATLEDSLAVSYKTKHIKHIVTIWSSKSHSSVFTQKKLKTYVHTNPCTDIAASFVIAKTWKKPRYPLGGE